MGREVQEIIKRNHWDAKILGIPSIYHLYPSKIAPAVREKLEKAQANYDVLAVVYGECGTNGSLDAVLEQYHIKRIPTMNCYEMFDGKLVKKLLKEQVGTYFLTDFLVNTFQSSVIHGMGLDKYPQLKDTFFHNLTRVVYLAQNPTSELEAKAQEISEYLEVPLEIYYTGIGGLEEQIRELIESEE